MRLICPFCEAKYEVPEDAIPETGRDVQCANCGHAWFQMRLRPETAAPVASAPPAAEPPPAESSAPAAEPAVPATAAPDTADPGTDPGDAFPEAAQDLEPDLPEDPQPAPAAAEPVATSAYAVDEGVLAILREEAEREALARRAEAGTMENQPDLGIEAALPARKAKEPPVAVVEAEADAAEKPAARRDLLPDVEEINSTLRPSEQPADTAAGPDDDAYEAPKSGGGFRAGFLLVMTVAILAAGVYVSAPKLAALVPSLSDPLASYVAAVDGVRVQLDGLMQKATTAINGQ